MGKATRYTVETTVLISKARKKNAIFKTKAEKKGRKTVHRESCPPDTTSLSLPEWNLISVPDRDGSSVERPEADSRNENTREHTTAPSDSTREKDTGESSP